MTDRWAPKGYPREYIEGFIIPDEEAVKDVATFITTNEIQTDAIAIQRIEEKDTTVVHRTHTGESSIGPLTTLTAINWSDPLKSPGEYEEYAKTFYRLDGPSDQQEKRAHLLGITLGVPVVIYEPKHARKK